MTEISLNTGQPGTGDSDMLVSSFKSNLLFPVGSSALNATWLCSSGRSIMSLSLNPDPVTRYASCLREERSLNEGPKLFMKFNATHIPEKRGTKMETVSVKLIGKLYMLIIGRHFNE